MKQTSDGRSYFLLMSQEDASALEVHPDVFDALYAMIGNGTRADGQVNIQVAGGQIVDVKVNASVRVLRHTGVRVTVGGR